MKPVSIEVGAELVAWLDDSGVVIHSIDADPPHIQATIREWANSAPGQIFLCRKLENASDEQEASRREGVEL